MYERISFRKKKANWSSKMQKLNYIIRVVTPHDEPVLLEILYHAIYVPENGTPPSRSVLHTPELIKYVKNWGDKNDFGLIALNAIDQDPIGAAWIRLMTKENPGYGYAGEGIPELTIAVLPEYRNKGVGTLLLTYLLQEVNAKYKAVSLSVTAGNPAIRIYERAGFKIKENSEKSLVMVRPRMNQTEYI